jgi:hypothetical protein
MKLRHPGLCPGFGFSNACSINTSCAAASPATRRTPDQVRGDEGGGGKHSPLDYVTVTLNRSAPAPSPNPACPELVEGPSFPWPWSRQEQPFDKLRAGEREIEAERNLSELFSAKRITDSIGTAGPPLTGQQHKQTRKKCRARPFHLSKTAHRFPLPHFAAMGAHSSVFMDL